MEGSGKGVLMDVNCSAMMIVIVLTVLIVDRGSHVETAALSLEGIMDSAEYAIRVEKSYL
jgi:hypothetical protein